VCCHWGLVVFQDRGNLTQDYVEELRYNKNMINSISYQGWRIASCLLVGYALFAAPAQAREVAVELDREAAVDQLKFHKKACGPACLVNALQFGTEERKAAFRKMKGKTGVAKMKSLTKSFSQMPSWYFKDQLFSPEDGMRSRDLAIASNQLLYQLRAPKFSALYADRTKNETGVHFLQRVSGKVANSLAAGQPVIATIEAYGIERPPEDKKSGEILWNRINGHFVLIVAIDTIEEDDQLSLRMKYLDPEGGEVRTAYLYAEERRKFGARKFLTEENEPWLKGSPFLQVLAPHLTMSIDQEVWHNRTTMHLTFLIGDFEGDKSLLELPKKQPSKKASKPTKGSKN